MVYCDKLYVEVCMVISFCGHAEVVFSQEDISQLKHIIVEELKNSLETKFYLGGYGNFDSICLSILKDLKREYPKIEIVFVTPYLTEGFLKRRYEINKYDNIIYPPIEITPKRYAILKRNEWMVKNSDCIIGFVKHRMGGAWKMMEYARRKKIRVINMCERQ